MNLYIRLIALLIKFLFRPRMDIMDTSVTRFLVWPNDLDLNMHMNNGRYLTVMDLGRLDLMLRSGLAKAALKAGYGPVLGSAKIRYRLPLLPFHPFEIHTRLVCWDEKWAYMEQRFVLVKGAKAGAVAAIALVKAGLYDGKSTVHPKVALDLIGKSDLQSPPMPDYFADWVAAEESIKAVTAQ